MLGGDAIPTLDEQGEPIVGDTLLILMNAHYEPLDFVLPAIEWGERWEVLIDTRAAAPPRDQVPPRAGERYTLLDRSMAVLRLCKKTSTEGASV
jgi:glycogen operon protein